MRSFLSIALLMACSEYQLGAVESASTTVTVLHSFSRLEGSRPRGALTATPDGKLWGTLWQNGPNSVGDDTHLCSSTSAWSTEAQTQGCPGSVFRIGQDGDDFEVVYGFSTVDAARQNDDGYQPVGGVTDGGDGWVYGTTTRGGFSGIGADNGAGTAWRINRATLAFESLHHFQSLQATPSGAADGMYPYAKPVRDEINGGFLIGVKSGGNASAGVVVRMTSSGVVSPLRQFGAITWTPAPPVNADGCNLTGTPVVGWDGRIHGDTNSCGPNGYGTIYSLDPTTGAATVDLALPSYVYTANKDNSALHNPMMGSDGKIYGVITYGGANGSGMVYRSDASGVDVLVDFEPVSLATIPRLSNNTGGVPLSTLVEGCDGKLYGTTYYGGVNGGGAIFRLGRDGSDFELLHSFPVTPLASGGQYPDGGLVSVGGVFYGTTGLGGPSGMGVLFKLEVD